MEIKRLDARVDMASDGRDERPAAAPVSLAGLDRAELTRLLRPLVLEILGEELAHQLRMRGL